jgi:small subunit ribosomal protein S19
MAKEFMFRGKSLNELKSMSVNEFIELVPSRRRRSVRKGFTEDQKKLLEKIRSQDKDIKTHSREMIVLPEMVGSLVKIYNGKEFFQLHITEDMLGHCLGEFSLTRRRVAHNAPGVGATKSSSSVSVR